MSERKECHSFMDCNLVDKKIVHSPVGPKCIFQRYEKGPYVFPICTNSKWNIRQMSRKEDK